MKDIILKVFIFLHIPSTSGSKSRIEITLSFITLLVTSLCFFLLYPIIEFLNLSKESYLFKLLQLGIILLSYYIVFSHKKDINSLYDRDENPEMNFGRWNSLIKLMILMGLLAVFVLSTVYFIHFY